MATRAEERVVMGRDSHAPGGDTMVSGRARKKHGAKGRRRQSDQRRRATGCMEEQGHPRARKISTLQGGAMATRAEERVAMGRDVQALGGATMGARDKGEAVADCAGPREETK
eukprot:Gb_13661 [translate_table: standard]